METQEQMQGTETEAIEAVQEKTVRDEIVSAITEVIDDKELQLKLISATESYIGNKENYSIPDFTQILWDNFNEYKKYLLLNDRVNSGKNSENVARLDEVFRSELMPKIVQLVTEDRLQFETEKIRNNATN